MLWPDEKDAMNETYFNQQSLAGMLAQGPNGNADHRMHPEHLRDGTVGQDHNVTCDKNRRDEVSLAIEDDRARHPNSRSYNARLEYDESAHLNAPSTHQDNELTMQLL